MRDKHIDFILKDIYSRGEILTSEIIYVMALYQCKVKKDGAKRSIKVNYSAAESIMKGYRKITI